MASAAQPSKLLRLSSLFSEQRLIATWKKTVRDGLRNQAILDLHDYLDVHRNIEGVVRRLRDEVRAGTYRTSEVDVVAFEKKYGVTRRLVIPSPGDAILLQSIVDALEAAIRDEQP